jgi:hypothetical protein
LTGMLLYLVSVSTAPAGLSRAVSFPPVLATADPGMSRSSTVSRTGRPTWSIPSALSEFPRRLFDADCRSSPGGAYPYHASLAQRDQIAQVRVHHLPCRRGAPPRTRRPRRPCLSAWLTTKRNTSIRLVWGSTADRLSTSVGGRTGRTDWVAGWEMGGRSIQQLADHPAPPGCWRPSGTAGRNMTQDEEMVRDT